MTREEEIQKLIDEETGIDNYGSSDYQIGVCDGVRLADKTMLDRACEWLKENIDLYSYNAFNVKSGYTEITLTDEFETAFRQAMKGGAG